MKDLLLGEKIIQDSGFNFSRNYPVCPPYRIKDGRIYGSEQGISTSQYKFINLFEYYNRPMPRELSIDILGATAPEQLNPYTLLASIDTNNPQEVTQWFNHFGSPDGKLNCDHNLRPYYPLDNFKTIVREMSNMLTIIESLQTEPETLDAIMKDISEQYNGFLPGLICGYADITKGDSEFVRSLYSKANIFELYSSSSLSYQYVNALFQYYLSNICPCINWNDEENNGQPSLSWTSGPMLSQLYFMLALDITAGKMPRKCMNLKCQRYFTPARNSTLYCSDTCKERAKQHRHYKRSKMLP